MKTGRQTMCLGLLLCAVVLVLPCGCRQAPDKPRQFNLAISAAVNAMLFANPLAAIYSKGTGIPVSSAAREAQTGCPNVTFQGMLEPIIGRQRITLAYDNDCRAYGPTVSGSVSGDWRFNLSSRMQIGLEMLLTMQNFSAGELSARGSMRALALLDNRGPYARLAGDIELTHGDGRTRRMEVDEITAVVDLNDVLLDIFLSSSHAPEEIALRFPFNDMLIMDGYATLIDENNLSHTMMFEQVTQSYSCFFPVSGTITLLNEQTGLAAMIDFGDGTCDSLITVTIDAEAREIDLSQWLDMAH